jgi:hypothetical protein
MINRVDRILCAVGVVESGDKAGVTRNTGACTALVQGTDSIR